MWLSLIDLLCSVVVIITLQQWAVKRKLLAKPGLFFTGNLVFLLGMLPWFDELARYSISLHSLQSVLVHHFAPLLWISSLQHFQTANSKKDKTSSHWPTTLLMSLFALLTWVWMLPSFHPLLMQSALVYSGMKWLMALSGLALCLSMLSLHHQTRYWQKLNNITVVMPLLLWGLLMFIFPTMYSATHTDHHHHHMMMSTLPSWLQMSPLQDQFIGGLIFVVSGFLYWQSNALSVTFSRHARRFSK